MINEAELRRMTRDERRELARALAVIDLPHPLLDPRLRRRRRLALLVMMACCVALAGWIAILILTLPGRYTSSDWRAVWVGLDIAELRRVRRDRVGRVAPAPGRHFLHGLDRDALISDAWFDLTLDYGSAGFTRSVLSAVIAEIPLALLLYAGARRLVRVTVETVMRLWRHRVGAPAVAGAAVRGRPPGVPSGPAEAGRRRQTDRRCHSRRPPLVLAD